MKKIILLLLLFFIASQAAFATSIAVQFTGTYNGLYAGDHFTLNYKITNYNSMCAVKCDAYINGQLIESNIPIHAQDTPPNYQDLAVTLQLPNTATSKNYLLQVSCSDSYGGFCSGSDTDSDSIIISYGNCGDGIKNGNEVCDGTSVSCSSLDSKYYSSAMVSCKSDCSGYPASNCRYCGDGQKDPGEDCDEASNNGQVCIPSYGGECRYCSSQCRLITEKGPYCGDGKKDSRENCLNCQLDAGCSSTEQCSDSGACINVINDNNNCGSIGNRCDTAERVSDTGRRTCSADFTKAIITQTISYEQCEFKTCILKTYENDIPTDCTLQATYCQEGTCGCSEGYKICKPLKQCSKEKAIDLNLPCSCDFQCKEGFCNEGKCIKGLILTITTEKSKLKVGEESRVTLTVSNPLSEPILADLVLNVGNDVSITSETNADMCSGNQCKSERLTIGPNEQKDLSFAIEARTSSVNTPLSAIITYDYGIEKKEINLEGYTGVVITQCGNGKKEDGETSETCCIDAGCPQGDKIYTWICNNNSKVCEKKIHQHWRYSGIAAILILAILLFGGGYWYKHHQKRIGHKEKKHRKHKTRTRN